MITVARFKDGVPANLKNMYEIVVHKIVVHQMVFSRFGENRVRTGGIFFPSK
jgi:hypothetical protein